MKRILFLLLIMAPQTVFAASVALFDAQKNNVRGIVCDNLRDGASKNYLVLKAENFTAEQLYAAAQKPVPADGELRIENGEVRFYPPAEFSPESVFGATRDLKITVANAPLKIILARPTVVLVHGINQRAESWIGVRKQGGLPSELRRRGYDVALFEHGLDDWDDAAKSERGATYFKGNGPVEWQANRLARFIEEALARRRADGFATQRVDIVARSYGGLITRWYLRTRFGGDIERESRRWYVNSANVPGGAALYYLPNEFLDDDWLPRRTMPPALNVRKVILLSSFWRGVPVCNYLNEINSADAPESTDETNFADAPMRYASRLPFVKSRLGDWRGALQSVNGLLSGTLSTFAPSLEVIGINSRWGEWLHRQPFLPGVAYVSVAGTDNHYPLPLGLRVDSYNGLDAAQRPSWFPYLKLETPDNFSDGVVPVWSALIPRVPGRFDSQKTVFAQHRDIVVNNEAMKYIIRALHDANLPIGEELNERKAEAVQVGVTTWNFQRDAMTPDSHTGIYVRRGGVARINPYALREISDAQVSVPQWENGVARLAITWHSARPIRGRVRLFRPWRDKGTGEINFIPVQVVEESKVPVAVSPAPCAPSEIPGPDSCPAPSRFRHEIEMQLAPGEYFYRVEMETSAPDRVFVASDGRFRARDFAGKFTIAKPQ